MTIIGTRPEAIKMAPVIRSLSQHPHVNSIVCSTGQHKQMLHQVTDFFGFSIDIDLEIMTEKQDLFDITAKSLVKLRDIIKEVGPDRILVHGDTTTCLAGAMAGFYSGVEVGHVEAGLRTYNLQAPFPEEANRSMVSRIANYHFCPTAQAKNNLLSEGIKEQSILVTGNTVIDALLWGNEIINARYGNQHWAEALGENLVERIKSPARKMALITGHRRENLGKGFDGICDAIKKLSAEYPEIDFVYPVHLNPKVRQPVAAALGSSDNIHLIEPQDYATFIWLMNRSHIILTDSGGIQE
jgi:UDP-N-acetylglucosamine 2-epimerase (non-hydrolysing)